MVGTTASSTSLSRHWVEPKPLFRLRRSILLSRLRRSKRLIFIAGCARSGTSLLRKLMSCFEDVVAVDRERSVSHFLDLVHEPQRTLVVKRTNKCYRELPHLPECVELIYCVRHPYDCLTSSHPETAALQQFHVLERRWTDEYDALCRLVARQPQRQVCVVRYEDLVSDPDAVQEVLCSALGSGMKHRFSSNPLGIDIRASSVGKWRRDQRLRDAICSFSPSWKRRIAEFCEQFGYETSGLLEGGGAAPQSGDIPNGKVRHG
jgi:hypothetical protein